MICIEFESNTWLIELLMLIKKYMKPFNSVQTNEL